MNKKKLTVGVVAGLIVALALVVLLRPWRRGGTEETAVGAVGGTASRTRGDAGSAAAPGERGNPLPSQPNLGEDQPDDAGMAKYLQDKFGATIHNKHTQIKAIEKLLQYLMKFYPDDWKDRVYEMLKRMFPDRADELYEKFVQLTKYNDWVKENRSEVMKLSRAERRQALWDKRHQIFGADADEIWAVALKNERIYDALDAIANSPDTSVDQKFETYMDAVREAYGEQAPKFIERKQTELMNTFLSVDAVQDDLHGLAPEERRESLRDIREAVGLDEEALQRWDELDTQRDQEWSRGEQYMAQRREILESSTGEEQARRLAELREQLFGTEAAILQAEEEAGFHRFDHRRKFGKE